MVAEVHHNARIVAGNNVPVYRLISFSSHFFTCCLLPLSVILIEINKATFVAL